MSELYPINPDRTLMLGIDWQVAFGDVIPVPGAAAALENAKRALTAWRPLGLVVLTRHVYGARTSVGRLEDFIPGVREVLSEDSPLAELYPNIRQKGDVVLDKSRFNALSNFRLEDMLERRSGLDTVVVHGLTTPICVQTTVDALMMKDKKVILLADACASQALGTLSPEVAHDSAIQRMGALFAEVITADQFLVRIS